MTQTTILTYNTDKQKPATMIKIDNPENSETLGIAHALKVLTYVPKTSLKEIAMTIRFIENQSPDKDIIIIAYTGNDAAELAQLTLAVKCADHKMDIIPIMGMRAGIAGRGSAHISHKDVIMLIGDSPLADTKLICKLTACDRSFYAPDNSYLFNEIKREKPKKKHRKEKNRHFSKLAKHGQNRKNIYCKK